MATPAKSRAGPDEVSLGEVVGIFGTAGEVRLHLHNRTSQFFSKGREVWLVAPDGGRERVHLKTRPGAGGRVIGRVRGLRFRDEARALMGHELVVAKVELPRAPEGEYYHHQLVGLRVETGDGQVLGHLAEIHSTGPVDMWVVHTDDGDEISVPALKELVETVDVAGGRVILRAGD